MGKQQRVPGDVSRFDIPLPEPILKPDVSRFDGPGYSPTRTDPGTQVNDGNVGSFLGITLGVDNSELDSGVPVGYDINEARARNQTTTDKWISGGIKGVATFGTTLGQTVGTLGGGIAAGVMAALGNDFDSDLVFKNFFVEYFSELNDTIAARNPNYYTKAEQNASVLSNLGTANFWSDKMLNGIGFVASAIATGYGAGAIGARLGLSTIGKAGSLSRALGTSANTFQAAVAGRIGESGIEANETYERTIADLTNQRDAGEINLTDEEIELRAKDARAMTFAFNMALAIPDAYQLGKIFKTFRGDKVARSVFGGSRVAHAAEQAIIESQEENYQLAVSNMAINMANGVSSPETERNAMDYVNNVVGGMLDNFNTKEGQESMVLGGLLGGGMGALMKSNARTEGAKKSMQDKTVRRGKYMMDALNANIELNKIEALALERNDFTTVELIQDQRLMNEVYTQLTNDNLENYKKELEGLSQLTTEEFAERNVDITQEEITKQYEDIKTKIKLYEGFYNAIDDEIHPALKGNLFYAFTTRDAIQQQRAKLAAPLSVIETLGPDIDPDHPINVAGEVLIPADILESEANLKKNEDAITKHIKAVESNKTIQANIIKKWEESFSKEEPIPPTTPDQIIGRIQKRGEAGITLNYIKKVINDDGTVTYTTIDSDNNESIINALEDEYVEQEDPTIDQGQQRLGTSENYLNFQAFRKKDGTLTYIDEDEYNEFKVIMATDPNWRDRVSMSVSHARKDSGTVVERITQFVTNKFKTIANVMPTGVKGMLLVPSSSLTFMVKYINDAGEEVNLFHATADPNKFRDHKGNVINFSDMTDKQFNDNFDTFGRGTRNDWAREQKNAQDFYRNIEIWMETNNTGEDVRLPDEFVDYSVYQQGFDFTEVGEWSAPADHTMLKENGVYQIIDTQTGEGVVLNTDGSIVDPIIPESVAKTIKHTRYLAKMSHPTLGDVWVKATPNNLNNKEKTEVTSLINAAVQADTKEKALAIVEELNHKLYIAYKGAWNFKFDVRKEKGESHKVYIDAFNRSEDINVRNISIDLPITNLAAITKLIDQNVGLPSALGAFPFKKNLVNGKITNNQVEKIFTINVTPEVVKGAGLRMRFNPETVEKTFIPEKEDTTVVPPEDTTLDAETQRKRDLRNNNKLSPKRDHDDDVPFKKSPTKATDIINYKQAAKWLAKVLPKGIQTKDISEVLTNIEEQEYTWGEFADNIVYLSQFAQKGTEYHEAFHAVFRTLIPTAERARLYKLAIAKWGEGQAPIFYEEKMADLYMEWKVNQTITLANPFRAIFKKIQSFTNWILNKGDELEMFFRKIDSGAFVNTDVKNFDTYKFGTKAKKLLTGGLNYRMSVVKSEEIIYTASGAVLQELQDSTADTLKDDIDRLVREHMLAKAASNNIELTVNEDLLKIQEKPEDAERRMVDLEDIYSLEENIEAVSAEVLKLAKTYEITQKTTEEGELEDDELPARTWDIHQGEYGGWKSVNKEIKQFIAITTFEGLDSFNRHITRSVDYILTYQSIQRRLSGKPRHQQLDEFKRLAKRNPQVQAVYNKFLDQTGYDSDNNTVTNQDLFNRFLNTFELESIDYLQALRANDPDSGNPTLRSISANRNNTDVIHFESWEREASELDIFSKADAREDAVIEFREAFNSFSKRELVNGEVTDKSIDAVMKSFALLGIDLSPGFVEESLEVHHGLRDSTGYRMLTKEDITVLGVLLKQGDNLFTKTVTEEGEIDTTDARNRLIGIASGDVNYREDVYETSFQDAENKTRWAYVQPSYIMSKIRELRNISPEEFEAQLKSDPYFKYNPLVRNADALLAFKNLQTAFTGDFRDSIEETDGVTFKTTNPKNLLLTWYAHYKETGSSYYTPMIYEAKSTSVSVNLPASKESMVDNSGTLKREAIDLVIDTLFSQEHQRLNGLDVGANANNKEKWVNLPFIQGKKYKNETLYSDIPLNEILEDGKIRDSLATVIREGFKVEIEAHQNELIKFGIIERKGKTLNSLLLKEDISNVREYTANYYMNDFINSISISQLLQGDLSIAENSFDRVKRNGGEIAYGTHFGPGNYNVVYKSPDFDIDGTDRDDAQVYVSLRRRIFQLERLGRMNDKLRAIYAKIQEGEQLTSEESRKIDMISLKTVHYDGKTYHKMSEATLTKEFTSEKVDGVWVAQEGMEKLHNMREFMDQERFDEKGNSYYIDSIVPTSASKLQHLSTIIEDSEFTKGTVTEFGHTPLANDRLRLQMETKSGKREIKSGTQMSQLINLMYETDPQLHEDFYNLQAATRKADYTISHTIAADTKKLSKKLIETLELSGNESQVLSLLEESNGEFKYDFNLPHVVEKLEQILISHFAQGGLAQKVPGYKLTLMSAAGYKVNGKELRMHRLSKDGKTLELAEVAMTRRALTAIIGEFGTIEEANERLLEMVGVRIPTQAHHSMLPFKVVAFLPEYYGDVVIAPSGIVKLSGADYDIDTLYVYRKSFYTVKDKKGNKKAIIYGEGQTAEERFDEYLHYYQEHKDVKGDLAGFDLATTLEEFKKLSSEDQITNAARNNALVNIYLKVLTDPNVEDMFDNATLDLLDGKNKDVQGTIPVLHDVIRNKDNQNDTRNHYSVNGKLAAHTAAATGKQNVSPVAFVNNVAAFYTKHSIKLTKSFNFLGKKYGNYGVIQENDIEYKFDEKANKWMVIPTTRKNKSKINSLSTIVSAMTDDAKHGFSAKLNLHGYNLGVFANMIALGIGFQRTMLFASQPILEELSLLFNTTNLSRTEVLKQISEEVAEKVVKTTKTKLTDQDLLDNLTDRSDIIDLQVLKDYAFLAEIATPFQTAGSIIGLNKGANAISIFELEERNAKIGMLLRKENGDNPMYGDSLLTALDNNPNASQNIATARSIEVSLGKWFLATTQGYKETRNLVRQTLKNFLLVKERKQVDRAVKSHFAVVGLRQVLKNKGFNPDLSVFNGLVNPSVKDSKIEQTLASAIAELSNPDINPNYKDFINNEFIKILRTQFKFTAIGTINTKNESNLDLTDSIMRIKRSPLTMDRIINGFVELSIDYDKSHPTHPNFVQNFLRYALAKDNLQFTNTSFLKFLDVAMFKSVSEGLKELMITQDTSNKFEFAKVFGLYQPNNHLVVQLRDWELHGEFVDGGFIAISKQQLVGTGKSQPPYIFRAMNGKTYVKTSKEKNEWRIFETFGSKFQLPYHMTYAEALAYDRIQKDTLVTGKAKVADPKQDPEVGETTSTFTNYLDPTEEVPTIEEDEPSEDVLEVEHDRLIALQENEDRWNQMALSAQEDGEDINQPESPEEEAEWKEFGTPFERSVAKINEEFDNLLANLNVDPVEANFTDYRIKKESRRDMDANTTTLGIINYNFDKAIARLSKRFNLRVELVTMPDAKWRGKYQGGVVYLNLAHLRADTPFHEFAHPFVEAIAKRNPELYTNLKFEILKEKKILAKVTKIYPDLSLEGRMDEAVTTAIGLYAADIANVSKSLGQKILEFLKEVAKMINDFFAPGAQPLISGLDPKTTLRDLGAIMAKGTQTYSVASMTSEQAKEQREYHATKLTVQSEHVEDVRSGQKTISLRDPSDDVEYEVGDELLVYANSQNQGIKIKIKSLTNLKNFKKLSLSEKDRFAKALGYADFNEFINQDRYAKEDSQDSLNFPSVYRFIHDIPLEGQDPSMDIIAFEMIEDNIEIEEETKLISQMREIKLALRKQIKRYTAKIDSKDVRNRKGFVTKREKLLRALDAIDDVAGLSKYITEAKKELLKAEVRLSAALAKAGKDTSKISAETREYIIEEMHSVQEFLTAYEALTVFTEKEVKQHVGESAILDDFLKVSKLHQDLTKDINKTIIPMLGSWLLEFQNLNEEEIRAGYNIQVARVEKGNQPEETKAAMIKKIRAEEESIFLTQETIEEQLRQATKDIGFGSLWLEAAGQASDQVSSLFIKAVKEQDFKANLRTIADQARIGLVYHAYQDTTGKKGDNVEKFYKDFTKTIRVVVGKDENNENIMEDRLVFVKQTGTKEGDALLNELTAVYEEALERLPDSQANKLHIVEHLTKVDYLILPYIRKSSSDRLRGKGVLAWVKADFEEIFKPMATDDAYGYQTENGEQLQTIPIYYTNRGVGARELKNDDISVDLTGSILKFSQMTNKYEMFREIQSKVDFFEQNLGTRGVAETTAVGQRRIDKIAQGMGLTKYVNSRSGRVNQRVQEFINMQYYGMGETPWLSKFTIKGDHVDYTKLLNFIGKWTGFTTLALNFLSALNNVILGNFYIFQESVARQNFGNLNIKLKDGHRLYAKGMIRMVSDIGKLTGVSKETQLVRLYDAIQGDFKGVSGHFITGSKLKKARTGSSLFFLNHSGENQMQVTTLFSALAGTKVKTKSGTEINLWDAYILDDKGLLKVRDDVEWTNKQVFQLMNKLHATNKALHGNYNDFDKSVLQKQAIGRLMLMFRKFIAPGVRRRFGALEVDNEADELHEGFFATSFRLLTTEAKELKNFLIFKQHNLTDYEKANVMKTVFELGMYVTTVAMFALATGAMGDDDDSWAGSLVLYEIRRFQTELGFYVNPAEALKIFSSPAAMTTTLERIVRLGNQMTQTMLFNTDATTYQTNGHGHKRGDSKLWDATKKLIPVIQGVERSMSPEEAIKYFDNNF